VQLWKKLWKSSSQFSVLSSQGEGLPQHSATEKSASRAAGGGFSRSGAAGRLARKLLSVGFGHPADLNAKKFFLLFSEHVPPRSQQREFRVVAGESVGNAAVFFFDSVGDR
jgi:hypothetical protein